MTSRKWTIFLNVATLTVLFQFAQKAQSYPDLAQGSQNSNTNSRASLQNQNVSPDDQRPTWKYKRDASEFKANRLRQIPGLQDLPAYTGGKAKYIWGEEMPNAKSGKAILYNFDTSDSIATIDQWYRQHLNNGGWTIASNGQPVSASGAGIIAKNGRNSCTISMEARDKGQVNVRIIYRTRSDHP